MPLLPDYRKIFENPESTEHREGVEIVVAYGLKRNMLVEGQLSGFPAPQTFGAPTRRRPDAIFRDKTTARIRDLWEVKLQTDLRRKHTHDQFAKFTAYGRRYGAMVHLVVHESVRADARRWLRDSGYATSDITLWWFEH